MAPKKKKAVAPKKTPQIKTDSSASALGNMYSGMGSSVFAPSPKTDSSSTVTDDTLKKGMVGGQSYTYMGGGSTGGETNTSNVSNPVVADKDKDAFAMLKETFRLYDLEDLFPSIEKLMMDDVGPEQAALLLKTDSRYNARYIERFSGNEARRKAGLNVLSEAEYLTLEDSYTQTLQAYGLPSQLGVDRKARQAEMAKIIGADVSATEFKNRIETVVTRVQNADPAIKATMTSFFGIKDSDLVSYFLNPKEGLPKLQEKVTAAEIGAAAKGQSLATSAEAATALAQFGVTKEAARDGYATIGEMLPTASKLGSIYGDTYTQETAEQEVFKGTASAKRKRERLAQQEIGSFSGTSGRLRTGQMQGNTGTF
jgi:hypothetical protein